MRSLHIKFIKNNHTKMELLYFDLYLAGNIEHIGRTRQNSRDNPEIERPPVLTINLIIAINIKRSQEQQDLKVSIRHNKSIIRIPISSGLTGIVDGICIILQGGTADGNIGQQSLGVVDWHIVEAIQMMGECFGNCDIAGSQYP